MASTSLLKRSTPSDSEDVVEEQPARKRQRVENDLPITPPAEEAEYGWKQSVVTATLFDDDPRQLLRRSIALALNHVGFEAASREALEAFSAEVDAYVEHFLSKITSSMLNSRRSQATPKDFEYGLREFSLPMASLEPHLKPPIPKSKSQIQLEPLPAEELTYNDISKLIGNDLSGDQEKKYMPHVPKNFPSFPSKHTYRWTEKESARETDPRKIREEAAKAARQGEESLRRLTKVGKAGQEKDVKNAASKDPKSKERHKLWENALAELAAGKRDVAMGGTQTPKEDDRSMIVNAERSFYRKGVPAKRKQSVLEGLSATKT